MNIVKKHMTKVLTEGILKNSLPNDILQAISSNKTSLGNNPSIPDIFDEPYLMRIVSKRFTEVIENLKNIGSIDDVEGKDVNSVLQNLILKCKELEKPIRNELEKICFNYVVELFDIPDDMVSINLKLTDNVDLGKESILLDPIDGADDIEFDNIEDAQSLKGEIYKRRLLDVLNMGASIQMSSNIDSYADKIEKLNPKLCDLYNKIIALNNYVLFTKEDFGMTDENKMQIGTVEVKLHQENELVEINAEANIFPVLLSETIRGFIELFISHGLPKDKNKAMMILGKSDYLKAEPWDMRLGPSLWILYSNFFNDISSNELPYIMKRVATLNVDDFNYLSKEVFAKTKKGRRLMYKLSSKAKNDAERDKFDSRMDKMRQDKSMITDDYIYEGDLKEGTILYHCTTPYKDEDEYSRNGIWLSDEPDEGYGNIVVEYDVDFNTLNIADQETLYNYIEKDPYVDSEYPSDCACEPWGEQWLRYMIEDGYDGYQFEYCDGVMYTYIFDSKNVKKVK